MPEFTPQQMIAEAAAELAIRRTVYPRLVQQGRMKQAEADRRIDLMEAIVRRLTQTAAI